MKPTLSALSSAVHSMINRHTKYLKAGDTVRASAMGMPLEKLVMPVNDLISRLDKAEDAYQDIREGRFVVMPIMKNDGNAFWLK